jgi:TPR repeat protein
MKLAATALALLIAATSISAAGQTEADTQLKEARIYLDKASGRYDYAKGESLLRQAADSGLAEAQFSMGLLSLGAFDNPPNFVAAADWLAKASARMW